MNKGTSRLSTTTLAAVLALGTAALGAAPAAAEPPGNNSCTAYFISGAVEEYEVPGGRISGLAKGYAAAPDTNVGTGLVSQEAHWDRDACASFQPTG